jgi:AmmeMemoRadiSam system protein B
MIVSTDLSHYRSARAAQRMDERTAAAIEALDVEAIRPDDACGAFPLRAALAQARSAGWRVRCLDLRTSADTGGSPERVVGYGAFAIEEPASA